MQPNELTAWAVIIVLVVAGVFDVVTYLLYGEEYTITWVVQAWMQEYPPLGILIGIIFGHLFFPGGWRHK